MSAGAAPIDPSNVSDPSLLPFLEAFQEALRRSINGDMPAMLAHHSHGDDVMIMGAYGAYEKGWPAVEARHTWAGTMFQKGGNLTFEYVTGFQSGNLAFTAWVERQEMKIVGVEKVGTMALRVTHMFRKEGGVWKLMARHADPLVTKSSPDSVLQKA